MIDGPPPNRVHPTAVVGDDVQLGHGNVIGAFTVLLGPAELGDDNWIGPHVVIGTPAEIRGIEHGAAIAGRLDASVVGTGVRIGSRNVIREFAAIHQGHYALTTVADDCYLMNRVYLGHDGEVAEAVTMAAGVTLGGHVHVGAGANLGMGTIVHQRRVVGPMAMVGMGAVVTRDVPPFAKAYGNPCRVRGANRVGMTRAGVSLDRIDEIDRALVANEDPPLPLDDDSAQAWRWWEERTRRGA